MIIEYFYSNTNVTNLYSRYLNNIPDQSNIIFLIKQISLTKSNYKMYTLPKMTSILCLLLCCLVFSCHAYRCDNTEEHSRSEFGGVRKWADNTVPYEIGSEYNDKDRQLIVDSLAELTEKTDNCVMFVERTSETPVWVSVNSKDGCWSFVGQHNDSGAQPMSLDRNGCMWKSTVQHEFLHALGFIHEQKRPDRDGYVKILWENVEPKNKHNFDKDPQGGLQSYGLPYDYNSVMHYISGGFSTDGLPTMVTALQSQKQWRYTMGTGKQLTDGDIYKVKKSYGCLD